MNNKRIIIILMIFTIIFTLMGGTFAYFNWQSADNRKTNVTFTVNRNYTCGADSGGHITSSDVRLAPAKCTDSTYAIRRTITTSVTTQSNKVVSMKLWLNINSIDTNLTNTANFKWVIGKNKFGCESGIINQGDFRNIQNGKIDLFDGIEYATLDDTYYLYIWLDEAETNSNTMNQSSDFSIGGVCTDSGKEKAILKGFNNQFYFKEADYKTKVTDIYFIYDEDLPSGITTNNIKTYDMSDSVGKPITGYLIENTDVGADPDTYKVYVSSQYKIYASGLSNAFNGMTALKNIVFDNFDTSNVGAMINVFRLCGSLTSLDLSSFNTSNVTTMDSMFYQASSLSSVDVSYFDTSSVANFTDMFRSIGGITNLDLSNFDTTSANSMLRMFSQSSGFVTLDLSSFDTSGVTNMERMFFQSNNISTIYVSEAWDTSGVTNSENMFSSTATHLPNFNSSVLDKTNAHYGPGGYLTYKAYTGS